MMVRKLSKEELLAKAKEPKKYAMKYHPFYRGKIGVELKAPVRDYNDFAIWYTPGVAEPCKAIHQDTSAVFQYTNRANLVAVVTDGTRVLGLGDIGPEAALPVMEGKGMLFKYLGGVDAFPICLDTKDPDEIIKAVKWLAPTFGGINLEDIAKPKCFYILDQLGKELDIPVWHDDQQGTALVNLAGLISALKVVGKRIDDVSIAFIGAGAANINCVKYIILAGADPDRMIMVDSKGILNRERTELKETEPTKWALCEKINKEERRGGIKEAVKGADVCIALSRSGPGVIEKEWVADMADEAILFACANPIPEIWPWEAREAGVRIVATGRSDFPNQVNNSLGFPAVFRGTLDVAAKIITDEMCITASRAISGYAEKKGLSDEYIIPTMGETEMFVEEAVAVGLKAIEQGVARMKKSAEELRESASSAIKIAQETVRLRMDKGFIQPPPK
ncbi:NADP-dependent malic enzyme [Candidatus Aerophobetes bacterium]|uniref:NADP-dependent malic enzyme n=1 Tax=Aerophobetes bacterium TaxID=2030807 RepID=A0A523USG3_UNCAE|nr:MAG: NADP-dependent malic enzyme [Candidatus Aerophobetes bacterium]